MARDDARPRADAVAVLDHLDIARADVFGISLGGMTAEWVAIEAPSRVDRLCLASTTAHGIDFLHAGARGHLARVDVLRCRAGGRGGPRSCASCRGGSGGCTGDVARIERLVARHPARRAELLKHVAAGARHDARARVHQIAAPTLVIAGADDALLGLTTRLGSLLDAVAVARRCCRTSTTIG